MKRWLILMAMVVAMLSVASAKLVYYPNRWDEPKSTVRAEQVP
ncbi:MAG: hypothetical protein NZ556_09390 [Fimbriimonadales bacterium]|nr:hypothetical protein [Fimbriimonadales bacterium]